MLIPIGNLLYGVATKVTPSTEKFRGLLAKYVAESKITSSQQLDLAFTYLKKVTSTGQLDVADFEKSIGVSAFNNKVLSE